MKVLLKDEVVISIKCLEHLDYDWRAASKILKDMVIILFYNWVSKKNAGI